MGVILRKELADHLNSIRYIILFCLVVCVSLLITNTVSLNIRSALERGAKDPHLFLMLFTTSGHFFSLVQFIAFFGPLIGIIMGFDAINREKNEGTMSMLLSQPVYRDAIVNGKYLAGLVVVSIMVVSIVLLISGLGMVVIGVVPTAEQVARLLIYVVLSIVYIGFWLGLAILFSVVFRSIGTSALAGVAFWIVVAFFVSFATNVIADVVAPVSSDSNLEQVLKHQKVIDTISHISPVNLYTDAASVIMDPYRKTTKSLLLVGPMEAISRARFNRPLNILQSCLIVAPYIVTLIALTSVCFAAAYLVFMKQEIRAI